MSEDRSDATGVTKNASYEFLKTMFGIAPEGSALRAAGAKHGKSFQSSHGSNPTSNIVPGDERQAANGLEWERRGYKVTYVPRSSLLPGSDDAVLGDSFGVGSARLVVDDITEVKNFQTQMRKNPERFRKTMNETRREVDHCIRFEQTAARLTPRP